MTRAAPVDQGIDLEALILGEAVEQGRCSRVLANSNGVHSNALVSQGLRDIKLAKSYTYTACDGARLGNNLVGTRCSTHTSSSEQAYAVS